MASHGVGGRFSNRPYGYGLSGKCEEFSRQKHPFRRSGENPNGLFPRTKEPASRDATALGQTPVAWHLMALAGGSRTAPTEMLSSALKFQNTPPRRCRGAYRSIRIFGTSSPRTSRGGLWRFLLRQSIPLEGPGIGVLGTWRLCANTPLDIP